ncbi:uncharacterized protein LOC129908268 [Episyrphus balteatus]|uniref:uncharacterized protein LOC129908268 n=1 Tax=Episyrphus balteatus TaxID=286459 RepID=UPI00248662E6|nr:uncharacterized protein LOC129908268 [Episyrphus balteatus]
MEFWERLDDQESVNFGYNSSPGIDFQLKNKDQWRKILGTFDLIKDKTPENKTNLRRKPSIRKKQIIKRNISRNTPSRSILSSNFANTENEPNSTQPNLDESEIVWSSSNEESDNSSDTANINMKSKVSNRKNHLKLSHYETEINWSSSDSENDENSTQKSRLCSVSSQIDSESDLNLFLREIEKDLRRTKKINQRLTTKKGGYGDRFRRAVNKAKSDTCFLDYEHKAEIIFGTRGVIREKKVSYGSCFSNVQLETGSKECMFLGKNLQANDVGSSVVCFLDDSQFYTVNGSNVYIQPNKVIRS